MVSRPRQSATPRLQTASCAKQSKPLPKVLSSISFQKSSSHCGGPLRVKVIVVIASLLNIWVGTWKVPGVTRMSVDAHRFVGRVVTIGDRPPASNDVRGNSETGAEAVFRGGGIEGAHSAPCFPLTSSVPEVSGLLGVLAHGIATAQRCRRRHQTRAQRIQIEGRIDFPEPSAR